MTDYNFVDPPTPDPTDPNHLLIAAGRAIGVRSLLGTQHEILQAMASDHARYQASVGKQGHQGWSRRYKQLADLMPECSEFKEVCAESWDWNTMEEAAPEMYKSWRQSPGHWSAVNGACDFYGYAMALNEKQNVWYACGIFANLRDKE